MYLAADWYAYRVPSILIEMIGHSITINKAQLLLLGFVRRFIANDRNQLAKWDLLERVALGIDSQNRLPIIFDYDSHIFTQRLLLEAQITASPKEYFFASISTLDGLVGLRSNQICEAIAENRTPNYWSHRVGQDDPEEDALTEFRHQLQLFHVEMCDHIRCVFSNPYRPIDFDPRWRTETAVGLAGQIFDTREFGAMPILADALQDAGCEDADVLNHCRSDGPHVRGCWVVDAVLAR